MAPKRKCLSKAGPKCVKKTKTRASAPVRNPAAPVDRDGVSTAVRLPVVATPRSRKNVTANVTATRIRRSPRSFSARGSRIDPDIMRHGSPTSRRGDDRVVEGQGGPSGQRSREGDVVLDDSEENIETSDVIPSASGNETRAETSGTLRPLISRLAEAGEDEDRVAAQTSEPFSPFSPGQNPVVEPFQGGNSVLNTREGEVTTVQARSNVSIVAELREHQRGLVTATKKLVARSESKLLKRLDDIEKELKSMQAVLVDQKKEISSLKEYTNMVMYAVGGKSKDTNSLLTVVRVGVEKIFSSSNIFPVLRKSFLSWSVVGLLDDDNSVIQSGPEPICENGASLLRSIFTVRPTASKRNESFVQSPWLKNNQKLRALVVRAMITFVMNDRSTNTSVRVPGQPTEESKPSWLRSLRENHIDSVIRCIENGTEDTRGSRKTGGNAFGTKEMTETVVHRVHSVVVAGLNRSREKMRTSFFSNCGFLFDKRVKVVFCDGDCRPVPISLSMIPVARTGYEISSCASEVEENEASWAKVRKDCSFMSFLVHYEVDVYSDASFSRDGERKVLHGIINALHIGLELCLSFTQCSCVEEFMLLSKHSIMMVYMFALVVRDIILEKVKDISCVVDEDDQGDISGRVEEGLSSSEDLSSVQLCALMQPPSSTARARILQKSILRMTREKFETLETTSTLEPEENEYNDCERGRDSHDDGAVVSDEELNDLLHE